MLQSLKEQKEIYKRDLQQHCRKIERFLKEILQNEKNSDLSRMDDEELQMHCRNIQVMAFGFLEQLKPYGITQMELIRFQNSIDVFSVTVERINQIMS